MSKGEDSLIGSWARTSPLRFLWFILLIAVLFTAFYWPYITGKSYFPYDFQGSHYALRSRNVMYAHEGGAPLWMPQQWGGMSWCGIPETGFFYPFFRLLSLAGTTVPISWLMVLQLGHILFGAVGAFLLARLVCARDYPSLFAAVFFLGCGYLNGHLQHSTIVIQTCWLPWAYWLLLRGYRGSWLPHTLASGILLGLAGLAGSYVVYFGLVGAFSLVIIHAVWGGPDRGKELLLVLPRCLLLAAAYVVVSAVVILPSLEWSAYLVRGDYGEWSFPKDLRGVGGIIFHQLGYSPDPTLDLTVTVGVLPLLLAVWGVRDRRSSWAIPLMVVAALFLLLGFGSSTFLSRWATRWLPVYAKIRAPVNAWLVTQIALGPLIAIGARRLWERSAPEGETGGASAEDKTSAGWLGHVVGLGVVVGLVAVLETVLGTDTARERVGQQVFLTLVLLVAAYALGRVLTSPGRRTSHRRFAVLLLLVLLFVELGTRNSNIQWVNATSTKRDSRLWFRQLEEVSPVMQPGDLARYDLFNLNCHEHVLADFFSTVAKGYENAWGWHIGGLVPQSSYLLQAVSTDRRHEFEGLVRYERIPPGMYPYLFMPAPSTTLRKDFSLPAYRLSGVRYVVDVRPWEEVALEMSPEPESIHDLGGLKVYELPDPLPRCFLVERAEWHTHEGRYLEAVARREFDPLSVIHLWDAEGGSHDESMASPADGPTGGEGGVEVVERDPDSWIIRTDSPTPRWLFISQTWAPGWKATVNGEKVTVYRADFAFQAVRVPGGRSEVILEYRPASFLMGRRITLYGGSLLVLSTLVLGLVTRRRSLVSSLAAWY